MPLTGGVKHMPRGKSSRSKVAQGSSIKQSMKIDVIDEERTTMTDQISASESDTSSKGSNHSQHPLLNFMGAACTASSWFTSCFPCAIVDINDNDGLVVDKLSRESAMNAMYSRNLTSDDGTPNSDEEQSRETDPEQDLNVMYIQLQQKMEHEMKRDKSDASVCNSDASVCNTRSVLEDSSGDEAFDDIALNAGAGIMPDDDTGIMPVADSHEREGSSSVDLKDFAVASFVDKTPICSAPKKKKNYMKKLFGRNKTKGS